MSSSFPNSRLGTPFRETPFRVCLIADAASSFSDVLCLVRLRLEFSPQGSLAKRSFAEVLTQTEFGNEGKGKNASRGIKDATFCVWHCWQPWQS